LAKKLKVQEYLENHSLEELQQEFGIKHKFGPSGLRMGDLIKLCYSQIDSKPGPIVNECRGLILKAECDPKLPIGETKIIAYPFDRFYNYGQTGAAAVDWKTSKFFNKIDGTLIILFYYLNNWHASTKQVIQSEIPIDDDGHTFDQLFWDVMDTKYDFFDLQNLDKNKTYMFELVGPYNQCVVEYSEPEIFLLGIRNNLTFEEEDVYGNNLPFPIPHHYRYDNIDDLIEMVNSKDGKEFEGVVAVDENFNRVKIKNLKYLILHRLNDRASSSNKNMLELILLEKDDDAMIAIPPRLQAKLLEIKEKFQFLNNAVEKEYKDNIHLPTRKDFALAIQKGSNFIGPLMWMWSTKKSFIDWVKTNEVPNKGYEDSFLKMLLGRMKEKDVLYPEID
jgi:hypothetical protein